MQATPRPDSPDTPPPGGRGIAAVGLALTALLFTALAVPYLQMPLGGEQGLFSFAAWRISEGDLVYRDVGCHDGAGIYLVHWSAHSLFGWGMAGLRRFDLLWMAATFAGLALLARHARGRLAAGLTGVLAPLAYFSLGYQPAAQRDGFTLLPFVAGLLLARNFGRGRHDRWRAIGVGALVGMMFWIKPPTAALGAVFLLPPAGSEPDRWRRHLLRLPFMAVGFLLPAGLCIGYFAAHSALPYLHECLVLYNLQYAGVRLGLGEQIPQLLNQSVRFPVYAVGAVGLAVGALRPERRQIALATLLAAAVVALQGKLLPYHLVPLHLLLALGGAVGIASLWGERPIVWRRALALLLTATLAVSALPHLSRIGYGRVWSRILEGEPVRLQREESKLAAILRRRTRPDQPVIVWGVESSGLIPFIAKRRMPVRWIMNYPFSTFDPELPLMRRWRQEYLERFDADPPQLFIVVGGDAYPAIGNLDSREALARFTGLQHRIDRDYQRIARIDGHTRYDIYERRDQSKNER